MEPHVHSAPFLDELHRLRKRNRQLMERFEKGREERERLIRDAQVRCRPSADFTLDLTSLGFARFHFSSLGLTWSSLFTLIPV